MLGWINKFRRRRIRGRAFPPEWLKTVEDNVPYYRTLPPEDQRELLGHVRVFLAEKRFEGCGGLSVTDEIRVTIAAHACILLLHREQDCYPGLESVLVYPTSYFAPTESADPAGTVSEYEEERLGEAWRHGTVVLSWDDVKHDAVDPRAGRNVVLHEFAHLLDQQDEDFDGTPLLPDASSYASWARILNREFRRLQRDADRGLPTVIDKYGAEDPAEFFAVVTECFFQRPVALRKKHPKLYEELRKFYRQDPAAGRE